jgi:uncharacterized protein YjbI with pentapeptide repeats
MQPINRWHLNCQNLGVVAGTGIYYSLGLDPKVPADQGWPFTVCDMGDGTFVLQSSDGGGAYYYTGANDFAHQYQVISREDPLIGQPYYLRTVTSQAQFRAIPTGGGNFVMYFPALDQYLSSSGTELQFLHSNIDSAARFSATGLDRDSTFDFLQVGKNAMGMTFSAVSLAGLDLAGMDLSQCDMRQVGSLTNCKLTGAELGQANLAGLHLDGLQLAGANCQNADFTGCDFTSFVPGTPPPTLFGAKLTGAVVHGSLAGVDLKNTVLANADLTGADLSGASTDLTGANLSGQGIRYLTPAYQGSGGIGGYDLGDVADRIIAYDYEGTGHLNYLVCYRPGHGAVYIVKKASDANGPEAFTAVYSQGQPGANTPGGGIGGWDLTQPQDQIIAYDYEGTGHLNYLVCYRPGRGAIYILKKASDANNLGAFSAVYTQADNGPGGGIGGYPLTDPADQIIAYDYEGTGHLNYLVCYRPGNGAVQILKRVSAANQPDAFAPVYHQTGIGGYNLLDAGDRILAYDYEGIGHLNYLVCYRPGSGFLWVLKRVSDADSPDAFTAIYQQNPAYPGAESGYTLTDPDAQVTTFDYEGKGHLNALVCYRPGSRHGWAWIQQHPGDGDSGPGGFGLPYWGAGLGQLGGYYDLTAPGDRVIAYDYQGTGTPGDLVCYRPGTGRVWVLEHLAARPATLTRANLDHADLSGASLAGADLSSTSLRGATLAGTDLSGAQLGAADFTGSDLSQAHFSFPLTRSTDPAHPTVFAQCTLPYAMIQLDWSCLDLSGASIAGLPADLTGLKAHGLTYIHGNFKGLTLNGAVFTNATLDHADFTSATIKNQATFAGARMPGAFFTLAVCDQTDFSGVAVGGEDGIEAINFADAYLGFCTFSGANLNGAIFTDATLMSNSMADAASLLEANFANAYMPMADFTGAGLQGCRFDGAFMAECKLINANLGPARDGTLATSMAAACLQAADFQGVVLAGASLPDAAVTTVRGTITQSYYDETRTLTTPSDLHYKAGKLPVQTSLSDDTVCPDGSTYSDNVKAGRTLAQMMTAAHMPTVWTPRNSAVNPQRTQAP